MTVISCVADPAAEAKAAAISAGPVPAAKGDVM
jgi:hypothetical protein